LEGTTFSGFEFDGIKTFVELDWFVSDFRSKTKRYSLSGDQEKIQAAYEAVGIGSSILATVRGRISPLLKLGFELIREAVPTSVGETWFNLAYLSFGIESENLQKTEAVDFILPRLEKMGLTLRELIFKLFYLPPLPAATTTEGHSLKIVNGFTNIEKKRIEINVLPPRDYAAIFGYLVHETIHLCKLEKSIKEEPAKVEAEVEDYTRRFFSSFSTEWALVEKTALKDLQTIIETELAKFSIADAFLNNIMDAPKSKKVIGTMHMFFDAILDETVKAKPIQLK
jgi:hypothetical protein